MKSAWLTKPKLLRWMMLLLSSILCFLLALRPLYPATANSIDNLKQQRQQVDRQRQNLRKKPDSINNLQQEAKQKLTGLENNLKITNNNIQDNQFRLQRETQRLQSLQGDFARAEVSFQERREATIARLRYLQPSPVDQRWAI